MESRLTARQILPVLAALTVLGSGTTGVLAAAPVSSPLTQGKQKLAARDLTGAIKLLEQAVKQSPNSAEAHLCLGKAYCGLKQYDKARAQLRLAIRLGRGSAVAAQANQFMMSSIPAQYLKPRTGEGTELIASILGIRGMSRGIGDVNRPKVFEFYADWCEPCKQLKPVMEKIKQQYGSQVDFVSYDVDDANSAQFIDQYEVSPIPTIIFLSPDNKVVGYSIGFSGEKSVEKELKKVLSDSPS